MARKPPLYKATDDEFVFRCAGGIGILREEVWVDGGDDAVRYNLAFVVPHLTNIDNGRVLGYDNAHGFHERHFKGLAQTVHFSSYLETAERFYREVAALRREYED